MIRAQANILIARPVEAVFDFVAIDFFKNYRRWSPEVISLHATSSGPVRLGTQGRQVRMDMGFRTESNFRVSSFVVPKRVDFAGVSAPILSSYRMEAYAGKTRLTFIFEYSGSRLSMLPFKSHARTAVQQGAVKIVSNIKRLIESETELSVRRYSQF